MSSANRRSVLVATITLIVLGFCSNAIGQDLKFKLHNESSWVVVEFYASPADVGEWEDDILGTDVLGSGESANITIADGRTQCEYDLKFVFDDGDEIERNAVDLCETGSYTLTD